MAAPEPRIDDPVGVSPAALARFDTLCSRMGLIAEAVNTFKDAALRERAFFELVSIINPDGDEDPPDYHDEGVYCGEPAHCTPPHPDALPGTPYPCLLTRDSPEPADGTVLEDATAGGDVWARRDRWLPGGVGGKSRDEQRWYSLDHGGVPYTWGEMWARREEQGASGRSMQMLGPLAYEPSPPVPRWWTRRQGDGGLRRESGQVDDRKQAN